MTQKIYQGYLGKPRYFVKSDEYRAPRKGDYYLLGDSGMIFYAFYDSSLPQEIMREIDLPAHKIKVNGFTYILDMYATTHENKEPSE